MYFSENLWHFLDINSFLYICAHTLYAFCAKFCIFYVCSTYMFRNMLVLLFKLAQIIWNIVKHKYIGTCFIAIFNTLKVTYASVVSATIIITNITN